jgi:hypothetical protein
MLLFIFKGVFCMPADKAPAHMTQHPQTDRRYPASHSADTRIEISVWRPSEKKSKAIPVTGRGGL